MTKEDAIKWLRTFRGRYGINELEDAIEMAIKALEGADLDGYSSRLWKAAYERGKAEAEQRWIPVSERLPEEYGEYMITWTTSNSVARKEGLLGTAEYELTVEYDHENNRFKGEWVLDDYVKNYKDVKVIAWMPLPEPYRAESEEV